jgi:hypothetical protein
MLFVKLEPAHSAVLGPTLLFNHYMSTTDKSGSNELAVDLDLHFLPAWAQRSSTENKYSKFEGEPEGRQRRGDRPGGGFGRPRGEFRGDRPPRRDGQGGGGRPPGAGSGGPRGQGGRPGFRGPRRDDRREEVRREPPPPPLQLNINLVPEERGVEALARQIRLTGRAYPLFDIAHLILKKHDRYDIVFSVMKNAEGQPIVPLFLCALDDSLWLSEQEAVNHVLDKHFSTFYQVDKLPTDPPKGVYTFVAQCGMSGVILGPPNYHDYQNKLRKLHSERFSRMPFEMYKSRVKIVKDEPTVKKWLEEQSFRNEYTCLNVPETIKLNTREEVEQHFRATHLANVIKAVETHTVGGASIGNQPSRAIQNAARRVWEDQTRFPLKVVNTLSQQFAGHGLSFFKVNKNVTHVSVARPRYLDMEQTPVSDGVRRIVEFIAATPNCNRRKVLEALAPAPAPAPAEGAAAPAEGAPAAPAPAGEPPQLSPEAAVVNSDLHWLVHQGHVIEFANGVLELARKPAPRPPKPEARKSPAKSGGDQSAAGEGTPAEPSPAQSEALGTVGAEAPEAPADSASEGTADVAGSGSMTSVPDSAVPATTPVEGTEKSGDAALA